MVDQELIHHRGRMKRTSVVGPVLAVVGLPEDLDGASWVCRSVKGSGLRVGPAGHGLVHSAFDGTGVADLTDGRAWNLLSASNGTLVRLAIDSDLAPNAVGLDEWEKKEEDREKHS